MINYLELRERPVIAVFGGREISTEIYDLAVEFGKAAAAEHWTVINGGKAGVMEAVSKGVSENGGFCIGILPEENDALANPYCSLVLPSGVGLARNEILASACSVAVAIGGSYGTLSEIAYTLSYGKKVISLRSWNIPGIIQVLTVHEAIAALRELF